MNTINQIIGLFLGFAVFLNLFAKEVAKTANSDFWSIVWVVIFGLSCLQVGYWVYLGFMKDGE